MTVEIALTYLSVYNSGDISSDPVLSPSPPSSLTHPHRCIGYHNPNWHSLSNKRLRRFGPSDGFFFILEERFFYLGSQCRTQPTNRGLRHGGYQRTTDEPTTIPRLVPKYQGWTVDQVSFTTGTHSRNEEVLRKNLGSVTYLVFHWVSCSSCLIPRSWWSSN